MDHVKTLLAHGAEINARSGRNEVSPLEHGLESMSNSGLVNMVPVVQALLDAGAQVTERARAAVVRASETFEFYRDKFSPETVDETASAVEALCALFAVEPTSKRQMHNGISPIIATKQSTENRFAELWGLLVPGTGRCKTIQGEVIRIAGQVHDEWHRSGGDNWDRDYAAMVRAFNQHMGSHHALNDKELDACKQMVRAAKENLDDSDRLNKWAVDWVAKNPEPISLSKPSYKR